MVEPRTSLDWHDFEPDLSWHSRDIAFMFAGWSLYQMLAALSPLIYALGSLRSGSDRASDGRWM